MHLTKGDIYISYNRYNELYKHAGGRRGRVIDREGFSKYFNLPIALGDRLFEAFDVKKVCLRNVYLCIYLSILQAPPTFNLE